MPINTVKVNYNLVFISKLFMPPSSTNRFLMAPIKAARNSRRHLHSISCQEPVRSLIYRPDHQKF